MPSQDLCPLCEAPFTVVDRPGEFRYDAAGLPDVVLTGHGVELVTCTVCGMPEERIADERQLWQLIGLVLLLRGPGLRGDELRFLRRLFEMTQSDLAEPLQTRRERISEWEAGERIWRRPADEMVCRLVLLKLFDDHVIRTGDCRLTRPQLAMYRDRCARAVDWVFDALGADARDVELRFTRGRGARAWRADWLNVGRATGCPPGGSVR